MIVIVAVALVPVVTGWGSNVVTQDVGDDLAGKFGDSDVHRVKTLFNEHRQPCVLSCLGSRNTMTYDDIAQYNW